MNHCFARRSNRNFGKLKFAPIRRHRVLSATRWPETGPNHAPYAIARPASLIASFRTLKGRGSEFRPGLEFAAKKGWLMVHESGTYVRLMPPGEHLLK